MRGGGVMATQETFQFPEGGSIPTSPLQLTFEVIRAQTACKLNTQWHSRFPEIDWSNVVRNKRYICFGANYEGIYYAVAIWSSPIAANRFKDGSLLLELRRMAIAAEAPKNTASRMLSYMRKDITKRFPEIIRLISYQDTEVHHGTIYKASGWHLVETMNKEVKWDKEGRPRSEVQSHAPKVRWEFEIRRKEEGE
jgi:hypothetical protein